MSSPKSRIYFLLTGLFILGYTWIITAFLKGVESKVIVCPIKIISGYPCPSCGSTRSLVKLIEGDFLGAIYANPFGLIIFLILSIGPIWLIYDFSFKKESLWLFYNKIESFIKKRNTAIFIIIMVLTNWLWNLSKGL